MKSPAINSTKVAISQLSQKNALIEKFSLGAMAMFLLVLSIMDCKTNDRLTSPFLNNAVASSVNESGTAYRDFYNLFNFQDKLGRTEAGITEKQYAKTAKHSTRKSASKNKLNDKTGLAASVNTNKNSLKEYVVSAPKNQKIVQHTKVTKRRFAGFGIHPGISFAPEVGLTGSSFYNGKNQNSFIGGVQVGAIANIDFSNHLAFQPGIKYIMKGNDNKTTVAYPDGNTTMVTKTKTQYLEMPLNVEYKFGKPGKTRIVTGAGPYIAYLMNTQNKAQISGADNGPNVSSGGITNTPGNQNQVNLQKLDYGINGFVGCELPEGFYAKAGMELGLRDLQEFNGIDRNNSRNCSLSLTIGYLLGK